MLRPAILMGMTMLASAAIAADDVSIGEGLRIAIVAGCHDCHTDGFSVNEGQIDPEKALRGNPVGFQGPWGTTYPPNLRITLSKMEEDAFVAYGHTLKTRPPMPWFGVRALTENELRSFFRYVKSLGEPGEPAPDYVEPGGTPKSPYIVFAPPQMPDK